MKYYVKDNGKTYGPIEAAKIVNAISDGFFSPSCMLSPDRKDWLLFRQVMPNAAIRPVNQSAAASVEQMPAIQQPVYQSATPAASFNNAPFVTPQPPPPRSGGGGKVFFAIVGALLVVALACTGVYFIFFKQPEVTDFRQVCQQYQSAVGLVTVILEDSDGKLLSGKIGNFPLSPEHPIGTAFAIAPDQFVTNCHVAYGIKTPKESIIDNWFYSRVSEAAKEAGIKTKQELADYIAKNKAALEEFYRELKKRVRVRSVEIRLAHSNGKALKVSGVQIHPRYNANPENEYRNGEFDVAILHTKGQSDVYFSIAGKDVLHSLATGQKIAYMGFPMEGLHDSGNLDINNPEAIFKEGTINKITDFHNVFSTPEFNRSIIHDIPSAGGASGSPIFLPDGQVVAVLWGGTTIGRDSRGARVASAVQHNMAVRIDSLDAVRQESIYHLKDWTGEND